MTDKKIPFLETMYQLRTSEHIILYDKILKITAEEEKEVTEFLKDEYDKEVLNYPFKAPAFEPDAALWAAKVLYFSIQLLINRADTHKEIPALLVPYKGSVTAATMLSADLCLRFLPQVVSELKRIDADDEIIPILDHFMKQFFYSNIGFTEEAMIPAIQLPADHCFNQLLLNRVVEQQDLKVAQVPAIHKMLQANFGDYSTLFWKDFNTITILNR